MNSINKVLLTGYLGNDPEIKKTVSGYSYVQLDLATHSSRRKKNQEWERQTQWHRVIAFGKLAERCHTQLFKGTLVALEGALSSIESKTTDGQVLRQVSIVAQKLNFIFSKNTDIEKKENEEIAEEGSLPSPF